MAEQLRSRAQLERTARYAGDRGCLARTALAALDRADMAEANDTESWQIFNDAKKTWNEQRAGLRAEIARLLAEKAKNATALKEPPLSGQKSLFD